MPAGEPFIDDDLDDDELPAEWTDADAAQFEREAAAHPHEAAPEDFDTQWNGLDEDEE